MIDSLKKIEKTVRENGKHQVEVVEKESDEKVKAIRAEIERDGEKAYEVAKAGRKNEKELVVRRILSDAKMEKRKAVDAKKTEVLEGAFEAAKERILGMGREEKAKIMRNLAENGKQKISDPVVYADKKYADLIPEAKTADLDDFGVVVKSKDGSITIDNTLGSLIGRLKTKLKPELGKILFAKEKK